MSERLFITGAAGYVGAMLCEQYALRDDVECIIALDKEPMPDMLKGISKITWIEQNTSEAAWVGKVASMNPTIVIHSAWQIREMYGQKSTQWKWNVEGSERVFELAFSTPSVRKLIHFSTVASYAAYPTNTLDHFFKEEEGFRTSDYLYAEEKRIVEERLEAAYKKAHQNGSAVQVAIIRPAAITGPRGRFMRIRFGLQSALSGQLKGNLLYRIVSAMTAFVPVTAKWCRQFIHEDDIVDIVTLFAFSDLKNPYDAFNACPPGPIVRGVDMARAVGKKAVCVPPFVIRFVFFWMWHLTRGRIPTSRGGWKSYSYPIAVDGSKISRMYGYQYKMNSRDAFTKIEGRYAKYVQQ